MNLASIEVSCLRISSGKPPIRKYAVVTSNTTEKNSAG
jgi:hypothetical protein